MKIRRISRLLCLSLPAIFLLLPTGCRRGNSSINSSGPNRALFEYLGNPITPPANMNSLYNKEGLTQAFESAARDAGITLEKIEIEDTEFPFLVGIVFKEGDFTKLKEQIKKLDGYEYHGSIDSKTCAVMNISPWSIVAQRGNPRHISARLSLRSQIFCEKIESEK